MGASGWSYYTPYDEDPNEALRRLKADVFARGDYYRLLGDDFTPNSIEHLLEANETEGTHSILDMTAGCADSPAATDAFAMEDFGKVIRVGDRKLEELFGTTKPTRAQVEAKTYELSDLRSRWVGSYLTVYDEQGQRVGYFFTGFSGD